MKKAIVVALAMVVLGMALAYAADKTPAPANKEALMWQYRALVAEFNQAQQTLPQFKALQDFVGELDKQGLTIQKGEIVEKPKPAPAPAKPAGTGK